MTVIADNKKRVTLPTKPGESFDLQSFGGDKFILTNMDETGRIASREAPRVSRVEEAVVD